MPSDICNETGNFEVSPKVVLVHVCLVISNLLVKTTPVVAAFQPKTVAGKSALLRNSNRINPNQLWLNRLKLLKHNQR